MPTQLEKISEGLAMMAPAMGGMGAGLQGNLPQYRQTQQNQQVLDQEAAAAEQAASVARMETLYRDAAAALPMAKRGDYEQVIKLGINRLQLLKNFPDADPSDTQRVTQLAIAAKNGSEEAAELLEGELSSAVQVGMDLGVLERPERMPAASPEGKLAQDREQGYLTQEQYEQALSQPEQPADQRERKIAQYMEIFGMNRADAIRAVDSQVLMDETGNLRLFDPTSGTGSFINTDNEMSPVDTAQTTPEATIEDLAYDPGKGTGFGASFIGMWNSTVGQLPFMPVGTETEEIAQNLRLLERDAIRALGSSGRPPVVEQNRIAALVPDAMAWSENPEVARGKMVNFVNLMMNQYTDDMRFAADRSNPKEVRDTSRERANNIQSIMQRLLVPEAAEAMFSSFNRIEASNRDLNSMSREELLELDPDGLSPDQLDLYIQRLESL